MTNDDYGGPPANDIAASVIGLPRLAPDPFDPQFSAQCAARAIRQAILVQLRRGAGCCSERTETPYQARERFAGLCEVARTVDRLANAGAILLREQAR
jgi:hypothetical protein